MSLKILFFLLITGNLLLILEQAVVMPSAESSQYQLIGKQQDDKLKDIDDGAVAVSADKMNVFYIGIDNPISVAVSGWNEEDLELEIEGARATKMKAGEYIVHCSKPGQVTIAVSNKKTDKYRSQNFRVKRIPDPITSIAGLSDGFIKAGTMAAQTRIAATLENFDFDATCQVQSYTVYYTPKNQDPTEMRGQGEKFSGALLAAIEHAQPGDQYAFVDVRVRCPGDAIARKVNGLSFKIR